MNRFVLGHNPWSFAHVNTDIVYIRKHKLLSKRMGKQNLRLIKRTEVFSWDMLDTCMMHFTDGFEFEKKFHSLRSPHNKYNRK